MWHAGFPAWLERQQIMLPICWHVSLGLADGARRQNIALGCIGFLFQAECKRRSGPGTEDMPVDLTHSKPMPKEMFK